MRKQAEETDVGQTPRSTRRADVMSALTSRPRALKCKEETAEDPPSVVKDVLGEDSSTVSNNALFPVAPICSQHPQRRVVLTLSVTSLVGPWALPDAGAAAANAAS